MRALLRRCSPVVAGLILCTALAANGAPAGAAPEPAARQPLIEVVAFGVAPVAGLGEDAELQPKPGDILHRRERGISPQEAPAGTETRVITAAQLPLQLRELQQRVEDRLRDAARGLVGLDGGIERGFGAGVGRAHHLARAGGHGSRCDGESENE